MNSEEITDNWIPRNYCSKENWHTAHALASFKQEVDDAKQQELSRGYES